MQLRVWHVSNMPRKPFHVDVSSPDEAVRVLQMLADYDLYLGDAIVSNAQGLVVFEKYDGKWHEWYDDEHGDDIHVYANRTKS